MEEPDAPPTPDTEDTAPGPEPITLEAALGWLASLRAASVLALLREPEFAFVSMTAFAGFRVNATGYGNPLVRRRLAQEILQNDKFADRIRALVEEAPPSPILGGPEKRLSPPAPPELGAGTASRDREDELRAERDRRRRERDEARTSLLQEQQARAKAEDGRRQAEDERDAQARLVQQQGQRLARLERQAARMQAEREALLKALRQDKVSKPPRGAPRTPTTHTSLRSDIGGADLWQEAALHLLHKGKYDTALVLALDVLRADPDERVALDMAAQVYEGRGEARDAIEMVRRLLVASLSHGEASASTEALVRLLLLLPHPSGASREARQWLQSLRGAAPQAIAPARVGLERLRGLSAQSHEWLAAEIASFSSALSEELTPAPGALGPDDPLPLPGGWTARRVCDAVNANESGVVSATRDSLAALQQASPTDFDRSWSALNRAAEADDSVLAPLRRAPRGPVVVDGSNAAWFDQHSLVHPRARLAPILALRRALRRRGYFPVILYADAPLPYTIDDAETLRLMLGRGEIALVDSGVDADEVLLREAKHFGAPLITNDYMADWDPLNEVEKVQYTISLNGEAHLLS